MKAPVPPPTMPRRIRRLPLSDIVPPSGSAEAEQFPVGRLVRPGGGKIVEGTFRDADDVAIDQRCAFGSALLGMLQGAFPLEHGPAFVVVAGELGEDRREIDLAIAGRTEAPGPVDPAREAGIDALLAGRIELR